MQTVGFGFFVGTLAIVGMIVILFALSGPMATG